MGTIVGSSCGSSSVDKYIVEAAGKDNPKILFIPTASGDSFGCLSALNFVFNKQFGCTVDFLLLCNDNISEDYVEDKVMSADIINVGGGSAWEMMQIWRAYNMNKFIKAAYDKGTVLSGTSAGSICWFKYGNGDSNIFMNREKRYCYRKVEGTGMINALNYPHYNPSNDTLFSRIMKLYTVPAIALEDGCTFVVKDDKYKIMKMYDKVDAFLFKNNNGIISKQKILNEDFEPLVNLGIINSRISWVE